MRLARALLVGMVGLAALGGGMARAQEESTSRGYWINPALTGEWRNDQNQQQPVQSSATTPEDLALGFTFNGFAGITGEVELGRVTLNPDATDERISTYGHSALGGGQVDEAVGEARINWNVTDRLQASASYGRDAADPTLFGGTAVFEDELSGGLSYSITPRFAVSAVGGRQTAADSNTSVSDFTGDSAALNAEYQFMPYFSGALNYTYQSYDGQQGVLRHDESTLSLSLTGHF